MARIVLQQSERFTHGLQALSSRCVKLQIRKVCIGLICKEKSEGHAILGYSISSSAYFSNEPRSLSFEASPTCANPRLTFANAVGSLYSQASCSGTDTTGDNSSCPTSLT